jgi:hypothetical protein
MTALMFSMASRMFVALMIVFPYSGYVVKLQSILCAMSVKRQGLALSFSWS